MNQFRGDQISLEANMKANLAKISREADRLIQAVCDGVPGAQVKDRMTELEAQRAEIEAKLASMDRHAPLMHPNMAGYYRE